MSYMDREPTRQAIARLARDVRALQGDSLAEHGIYYRHSSTNVLEGQALITGGEATPYEMGFYVFDFKFPVDYPHRPPVATFRTVDGRHRTRFNPNCYRNGKVCLSVLNTWQGDQWTGCQTISSVLLAIKANVLGVALPLLNEPGVGKSHADFDNYHAIVAFKNLEVAAWGTALDVSKKAGVVWPELRPVVAKVFLRNYSSFVEVIGSRAKQVRSRTVTTDIYNMSACIDYEWLHRIVVDNAAAVTKSLESIAEIDV